MGPTEGAALTVRREQRERPVGHVGPVRFSFDIVVTGASGGDGNATGRARGLARADAETWCAEMRARGLVFQFDQLDDGWTEPGKFVYTACFGTDLMLDRGPGE